MYEIIYDYDREYDTEHNIRETFYGDWFELQAYIKKMKESGCYNISATAVGDR